MCLLSPWWKHPFWPVILPQHIKRTLGFGSPPNLYSIHWQLHILADTLHCTNSDPFFSVGPTNLEFRRQVDYFYNFTCATWNSIFSWSVSEGVARSSLDVGCVYNRSCTRPHLGPEILARLWYFLILVQLDGTVCKDKIIQSKNRRTPRETPPLMSQVCLSFRALLLGHILREKEAACLEIRA